MEHKHSLTTHYPVQVTFRASCACLGGTCCVRIFKMLRFVCNKNRSTGWNRNKAYEFSPAASFLHFLPNLRIEKIAPFRVLGYILLLTALVLTCPSLYVMYHFPIWLTFSILNMESTHLLMSDHMRVKIQKSAIIILAWDPKTSYASMNLNWVAKHISYLWNAHSYWERLKLTFTIRKCFYKQRPRLFCASQFDSKI